MITSYLTLRKAVGFLGISLPFILWLGALIVFKTGRIEESLSCYYHTGMGDVFVGTLFVIGAFLFSYKGYDKKDDGAGDLACFFAIGVALFPTSVACLQDPHVVPSMIEKIVGFAHVIFAFLFFLTLAYFALCQFTKSDPNKTPTARKKTRNRIYRACGYAILISIALIVLYRLMGLLKINQAISVYDPVFWLETVALMAFGISWSIKGEAILRDLAE